MTASANSRIKASSRLIFHFHSNDVTMPMHRQNFYSHRELLEDPFRILCVGFHWKICFTWWVPKLMHNWLVQLAGASMPMREASSRLHVSLDTTRQRARHFNLFALRMRTQPSINCRCCGRVCSPWFRCNQQKLCQSGDQT